MFSSFWKVEVLCRKVCAEYVRIQSLTMQFINHFDDFIEKLNSHCLSYLNGNGKLCLRAIEKEFGILWVVYSPFKNKFILIELPQYLFFNDMLILYLNCVISCAMSKLATKIFRKRNVYKLTRSVYAMLWATFNLGKILFVKRTWLVLIFAYYPFWCKCWQTIRLHFPVQIIISFC